MDQNPMLSVWTKPKETIREVINTKTMWFTIVIAGFVGIGTGLVNVQDSGFNESVSSGLVFFLAIVLGPIVGIAGAFIAAGIYKLLGKLLGGTGNYRDMVLALGPAYVPQLLITVTFLITALMYGEQFIAKPDPNTFAITTLPMSAYLITHFLSAIFGIWGTIITAKAIGVVHGFSSWRGLGVILIVAAIFLVIVIFVGIFTVMAVL